MVKVKELVKAFATKVPKGPGAPRALVGNFNSKGLYKPFSGIVFSLKLTETD